MRHASHRPLSWRYLSDRAVGPRVSVAWPLTWLVHLKPNATPVVVAARSPQGPAASLGPAAALGAASAAAAAAMEQATSDQLTTPAIPSPKPTCSPPPVSAPHPPAVLYTPAPPAPSGVAAAEGHSGPAQRQTGSAATPGAADAAGCANAAAGGPPAGRSGPRIQVRLARSDQEFEAVARIWVEALLLPGFTELRPPASGEEVRQLAAAVAQRLRAAYDRKVTAAAEARHLRRRGQALLQALQRGGMTGLDYQIARRQLDEIRKGLRRARRRRLWACLVACELDHRHDHHPHPHKDTVHSQDHHHHHQQQQLLQQLRQEQCGQQQAQGHQQWHRHERGGHQQQRSGAGQLRGLSHRHRHRQQRRQRHQHPGGEDACLGDQSTPPSQPQQPQQEEQVQQQQQEQEQQQSPSYGAARGLAAVGCSGPRHASQEQVSPASSCRSVPSDAAPSAHNGAGDDSNSNIAAGDNGASASAAITAGVASVAAAFSSAAADVDPSVATAVVTITAASNTDTGATPAAAHSPCAPPPLAGYLLLSISRPLALLPPPLPSRAPQQLHVDALAVAAEWRRRGVGGALLAAAERLASRYGTASLWLHVDSSNEAAVQLYSDSGYGIARVKFGWLRGLMGGGGPTLLGSGWLVPGPQSRPGLSPSRQPHPIAIQQPRQHAAQELQGTPGGRKVNELEPQHHYNQPQQPHCPPASCLPQQPQQSSSEHRPGAPPAEALHHHHHHQHQLVRQWRQHLRSRKFVMFKHLQSPAAGSPNMRAPQGGGGGGTSGVEGGGGGGDGGGRPEPPRPAPQPQRPRGASLGRVYKWG